MNYLVSAFPATGKSTAVANYLPVIDVDSTLYSKITGGGITIDNPEFPQNYLREIRNQFHWAGVLRVNRYILCSSHINVRTALADANMPYTLVYPHVSCKNEYVDRCVARGNSEHFIQLLESNWGSWIESCATDGAAATRIELQAGQYLADVVPSVTAYISRSCVERL